MTHFIPNIFQQHWQDASFNTSQTYLEFIIEPELMFAQNFKRTPSGHPWSRLKMGLKTWKLNACVYACPIVDEAEQNQIL